MSVSTTMSEVHYHSVHSPPLVKGGLTPPKKKLQEGSVSKILDKMGVVTGPFRRFSMHMWQNARANTVRRVMVCDIYFPFSKTL